MSPSPETRLSRRRLLGLCGGLLGLLAAGRPAAGVASVPLGSCPAWQGMVLAEGGSLSNWTLEHDALSSGALTAGPGLDGQALQLDWDMGAGSWVQARFQFPQPADLSISDIFGITLHGGPGQSPNTVSIMFADTHDAFYGYDMGPQDAGINQLDRWLVNLAFPKKALWPFWGPRPIDWAHISRFFVVVKRPGPGAGGGSGRLTFERLQADVAADWPRQASYRPVAGNAQAAGRALTYILGQQDPTTGLFTSWKEEETQNPPAKAWLYDQALVLIALTREGRWQGDGAANPAGLAADRLAGFITARQKSDGHWARCWNARTGTEISDDRWVGDQAWWVMALAQYARKRGSVVSMASADKGAGWLAARIDATGKLVVSTEGNVDAWWALMATGRLADADRIKGYLLREVWDPDLRYWWRGYNDPMVAMDAQTWLSAFARHPAVNRPELGLAALSFARTALAVRSADGSVCGLDGMGPVSVWNEGIGQYLAAGGEDAVPLLAVLLSQQRADGSLGGATESWPGHAFGWHTTWSGLAPTAWLYFALTGMPYPFPGRAYLPKV